MNVEDLRSGERFVLLHPIPGSFGASEISLVNIGLAGVQIAHAQPLRIGTRARLWFRYGPSSVSTQARVIWSHLSQEKNANGKLLYQTGLKIESADGEYAMAMSALFQSGVLQRDPESLERKRQREAEREKRRNGPILKMIK